MGRGPEKTELKPRLTEVRAQGTGQALRSCRVVQNIAAPSAQKWMQKGLERRHNRLKGDEGDGVPWEGKT